MSAAHAAELDRRLGDPWDPGNPLRYDAVLAADERAEMFAAGEAALDDFGLNAEFVPRALGGRFDSLDDLVQVMRAVYRRDPSLGLGYGASSFIASVNAWASGDDAQRRRMAALLLDNRRVASVYHELAHGNDFSRAELAARTGPAGEYRLTGHKEVITNVRRADAWVIFARTSAAPGSRSHSQFFVRRDELPAGSPRDLPRLPSAGMRGVQLGGIAFDDCPVPAATLLGRPGGGIETALRSFQLTRTALPAMILGILDTGLRCTLDFAGGRRLYGSPVAEIPLVRATIADAFTDLLIADCIGTVAARAVHLRPEITSGYASAAKFLISKLLLSAMDRLSHVLGSRFYVREGRHGVFQKMLRDAAPAGFGHAARVACLATILPQLPGLARRSWSGPDPAAAELFALDRPVPDLPFDRLAPAASGLDPVVIELTAAAADGAVPPELAALVGFFARDLAALRADSTSIAPSRLGLNAPPEALALAARYSIVLAASSCVNLWRHNRRIDDGFLADPTWVVAALTRLAGLAGAEGASPAPISEHLFDEATRRYTAHRTFDRSGRHLSGGRVPADPPAASTKE